MATTDQILNMKEYFSENDEVGVAHSIVHFANDSDSEAVLSFMRFKDGQIISMETGATPLSDDYQLIGS